MYQIYKMIVPVMTLYGSKRLLLIEISYYPRVQFSQYEEVQKALVSSLEGNIGCKLFIM